MQEIVKNLKRDLNQKMKSRSIVLPQQISPKLLLEFFQELIGESDFLIEDKSEIYKIIEELDTTSFGNQLDRSKNVVLFELKEEKPIGYIQIKARPHLKQAHGAYLKIGVLEKEQKNGVAKRLFQEALIQLNEKIKIIYSKSRSDNMSALHFFHKLAFQQIAFLEKDSFNNNTYYDSILLRKFINES